VLLCAVLRRPAGRRYRSIAAATAANPPHAAAAVDSRVRQTGRRTDTVPLRRLCRIYNGKHFNDRSKRSLCQRSPLSVMLCGLRQVSASAHSPSPVLSPQAADVRARDTFLSQSVTFVSFDQPVCQSTSVKSVHRETDVILY